MADCSPGAGNVFINSFPVPATWENPFVYCKHYLLSPNTQTWILRVIKWQASIIYLDSSATYITPKDCRFGYMVIWFSVCAAITVFLVAHLKPPRLPCE